MLNNNQKPPRPDMKRWEVKRKVNQDGITFEQAIFVDGELFEWEVDQRSLEWAMKQGPHVMRAVQKDIADHFIKSLSEFLDREVTHEDVAKASQTGWI